MDCEPEIIEGDWVYVLTHQTSGKVIEKSSIWESTTFRVWLSSSDATIRVQAIEISKLMPAVINAHHLRYIAAASRIADALTRDILLAPIKSSVIPLPHQLRVLSRAMSGDRVRYLLADEVGLGKTIEAGLILRELKQRGLVKRTLVIAPKGIVNQWVAEMKTHFNEHFQLVLPDDIKTIKRISSFSTSESSSAWTKDSQQIISNPWIMFDQAVVPMDSVKPLERRSGWSEARVSEYNRERFEDMIIAGWDLVIVDEAHRLGGSTDQIARYKLGQGIAESAPYLLLLSATPHQGNTDAFHRLISLIDAREFPDSSSVTRERVKPYVIRTEKRKTIDKEGNPLFKPRKTQLIPVSWKESHCKQKALYEAVTEYVREGYNQALKEKRSYIGFLMLLMQRLVVSSTSAIKATLERRLEVLESESRTEGGLPEYQAWDFIVENFYDLDAQEQADIILDAPINAFRNERKEVKLLLETAILCEQLGPDAKAEMLLNWLYLLQSEEGETELKTLIFTEFIPTQEMLRRFLSERGFSVVCLNGSMGIEERKRTQESFAKDTRILISTDAGGEGLNLQFCHVVINYDIPWNPMRLEQRIGRVDRIGQSKIVRAVNFVFENSVEYRVLEVLEQKLAIILEEFGVDKTGDVLDSAQAANIFDKMYAEAILNPDRMEDSIERALTFLKDQANKAKSIMHMLDSADVLDPSEAKRIMSHPLPDWIETMTISWLRSKYSESIAMKNECKISAEIVKREELHNIWQLRWPDGKVMEGCFTNNPSISSNYINLTLEEPRIRELVMRLPRFVPGQPIPIVSIPDVSKEIKGFWSLWQISVIRGDFQTGSNSDMLRDIEYGEQNHQRQLMPLFLSDNGKIYVQTAKHIWDQLRSSSTQIHSFLDNENSKTVYEKLQSVAQEFGQPIFDTLILKHKARITSESEKAVNGFASRRSLIERIGLPQVRNYRLNLLADEERIFFDKLKRKAIVYPEMLPLLILCVEEKTDAYDPICTCSIERETI